MRVIAILLFLSLFSCDLGTKRSPGSEKGRIHIVFDLDWTLVGTVREGENLSLQNTVKVGEEVYRVNDWAREMITELSKRRNVSISFFSGGQFARNKSLLEKIKLSDGSNRSFLDIAYKMLSYDDLTDVSEGAAEGARFSEKFKKDLTKISSDLDNIILIEDNKWFALNVDQQRNIFWLGEAYRHFEDYSDLRNAINEGFEPTYIPSHYFEWMKSRNKLALVNDYIDEALVKVDREGTTFVEAMNKSWQKRNFEGVSTDIQIQKSIQKAVNRLRQLYPDAVKSSRPSCEQLMINLLFL